MGLAGIILAAGESTRMGKDKALLPWPPELSVGPGTLLSAAIAVLGRFCDLVIVVVGRNRVALEQVIYANGVYLSGNPNPDLGQFSSLQVGLREVLNRGRDSALVTLVDRPPPSRSTLEALVAAFEARGHDTWAIVPQFQGRHGHPIAIGRELMEEFLKAPPTSIARDIEHRNQERISYLPVDDPFVTTNINTPEDYASLQSKP